MNFFLSERSDGRYKIVNLIHPHPLIIVRYISYTNAHVR